VLESFIALLIRNRWPALIALLIVTGIIGSQAVKVGIDNSVDIWFVDGDPALESYKRFQDTFGNDEVVAVAVVDDQGIWRAETLNKLHQLTADLEKVEGVKRVFSVSNARLIESDGVNLDIHAAMGGPVDAAGTEKLKAAVESDPVLNDRFVTGDDKVALLFAQMAANEDIDAVRPGILERVNTVLDGSGLKHHVAGIGVIFNALNLISQREGAIFMVGAFLLIFALLWPLFRNLAAVLASIGAVACALIMTRGIYGFTGHDENMVTMTLPVLVLILGIADCIHIFRYRAARPDEDAAKVLAAITQPCLFTTLTTMVGFAALATSRMAVVRDLGIFASVGIGLAFISSVIMAAFVMGRPSFKLKRPPEADEGAAGRLLAWTGRFSVANKEAVLGVTCLVILLAGYGVSKVEVDTYSLGFLAADHEVRLDSDHMESAVGPFTPLEILVRGDSTEALSAQPAILRGIHAFQKALVDDPQVRNVFSLADITARLHQVNSDDPATAPFEVPDNEAMVAEHVETYRSDPEGQTLQLADAELRTARITASVPVLSAKGYRDLIERTMGLAKEHLPDNVTVEPSGYLPLYVKMMDYVVESQVFSFGIAFVVVFLLIGLLFRSVRMTALAVLPNVLPVFVTLGVMGVAGVNLDVATVTITSIIIGIVVDDTIHYLHRFRDELRNADGDFIVASDATAIGCGRAIGATTTIFSLGFLILAFASVKSIVYFGLLTSLAMVVALVGDLLILPAVLVALKPRL